MIVNSSSQVYTFAVCRGHVVIWDDGTLQPLSSTLYHVTKITGAELYVPPGV